MYRFLCTTLRIIAIMILTACIYTIAKVKVPYYLVAIINLSIYAIIETTIYEITKNIKGSK